MNRSRVILDSDQAQRKLRRMAIEIAEKNYSANSLLLVGIKNNGSLLTSVISSFLTQFYKGSVAIAEINIDKKNPSDVSLSIDKNISGNTIIVVDDVANSGRTFLYAIQPLLKYLPASVQTLALVERTHKLFPINIDYKGISVSTTHGEHISVSIHENKITAILDHNN